MSQACRPTRRPEVVALSIPTYDDRLSNGTADAVMYAAATGVRVIHQKFNASLLAFGFNQLYCHALNGRRNLGITHFLLLHADVVPHGDDWLTVLLDEMAAREMGALSVVIPIKNRKGLTSTGVDMPAGSSGPNPWPVRRLTMAEVMELPETFDGDDLATQLPEWSQAWTPVLLVNTGLLLIDVRQPFAERICFTIDDRIVRDADGTFRPFTDPEDWNVSRQLHRLGVRYAATRKVTVEHVGSVRYPNNQAWGDCARDPVFFPGPDDESEEFRGTTD